MSLQDAQAALHNLVTGVNDTLAFIAARVDPLKNSTHDEAEAIAGEVHDAISGLRKGIADAQAAASAPGIGRVTNAAIAGFKAPDEPAPVRTEGGYNAFDAVKPAPAAGNYGFGDKLPAQPEPAAAVDPATIKPLGAPERPPSPKGKA